MLAEGRTTTEVTCKGWRKGCIEIGVHFEGLDSLMECHRQKREHWWAGDLWLRQVVQILAPAEGSQNK